jgi:hypothetical protein
MPRSIRIAVGVALLVTGCASGSPASPSQTLAPSFVTSAPPTESATPIATATAAPEPLTAAALSASGPAAREDHTWTVTADGTTALLFGGRDGGTVYGDLWAYDLEGDAWTEVEPGPGPAARFGHEAAWVDGIGLVIFAGQAGADFFNDLWAYDPDSNAWRQLPSSGPAPIARYGTCSAIAPDGRLWISHGFTSDGARFSDTRVYDFSTGEWTDESPSSGARPVERCLHACWWTDAGELTLYAGQTTGITALGDRWTFTDGAWTERDGALPPDRNLYGHARLPGATLVFGGQALDGTFLSDLWLLRDDAPDAEPLEPEGEALPGRAGGELILDAGRGRVLLFGGRNEEGPHGDLWELRGSILDGG